MSRFRNSAALFVALFALVLVFAAPPVFAVGKPQINTDISASITRATADTTLDYSTVGWPGAAIWCAYKGDSATVSVQGSMDDTNWFTIATKVCVGTTSAIALVWFADVTAGGSTASSYGLMPMPNHARVIVNDGDSATNLTLTQTYLLRLASN